MKIKRLEIQGFKSFADKAVLDFQQGVTGVVGPNGCGKSNIVDAIRWCMGEQSAKNLRGKAMEDVIFAGSDNRKPLGMAEVSLVFSTEDGRAPAKYLEFGEIQLTRRLYRDGESEYLINRTPCRLMDIAELFMDTGVGTRAYSIIEQGKIGQILHSRPEERRLLIEEAAGVTKYKVRKQLALRKIDATRQNLLRLADVMGEIKRQLNALQRQARKAEKFRECRDELRDIDLQFILHQTDLLHDQQHLTDQQLDQIQQQLQESQVAADTAESQVELLRIAVLDTERTLNLHQEQLFAVRSDAAACENGLGFQRREQENLQERLSRLEVEQGHLVSRKAELENDQARLQQASQTAIQELSAAETRLAGLQKAQQEQEQEFEAASRNLETQRRELFSATGEATQCRTRRETAHKRQMELGERLERHRHDRTALQERLRLNQQLQQQLATDLVHQQESRSTVQQQLNLLLEEEQLLRQRLPEQEQLVRNSRDTLSSQRSRLHSLQELEAQFAGYGQGVRLLMTESPLHDQFCGLLADNLLVPQEFEASVEAVLAERLQTVICQDQMQLESALEYLRTQAGGRAHLALPGSDFTIPAEINGAVSLLSLIELDERAADQIRRILAPVYLVEDLQAALRLGREHTGLTFVTRTGDVVAADGTVSGGSPEPVQGGIIHKKREIRELEEQVQASAVTLAAHEQALTQAQEALQVLSANLQAAQSEQHRLELLLAGLHKDQQQAGTEATRLEDQLKQLGREQETLEQEQQLLQDEQTILLTTQESAEKLAAHLEQDIGTLQAQLEGKRLILSAAREALTNQRVAAATLKEQVDGNQRAANVLAAQLQELQTRSSNGSSEQLRLSEQLQLLVQEIASNQERLQELLTNQLKQEEQLQIARTQHEEAAALLAAAEQSARNSRDQREMTRQRHADLSLHRSSIALQQEHLLQSLHDRHRMTIDEARTRIGDRPLDEAAARARQTDLERLVDELGEVNLMAIEEYAGMEQRYEFLAGQKADLEESLQDLQQAINRINRTTRQRFLETFTLVNQKFQEVFPRLFCGGKAELRLTDEQDLLETGIEIIVQPPGKKLSNVMLLSGGEKALTAVALIFAIFLIKPTPFCLLDEVDAPLDDANIGRFNEMVREMSTISQFIIITHNKATMAVADTLYGITMEEPGASRLVSVKLH